MPTYHFTVGNSVTGPVGFQASINANFPAQALDRLKSLLPGDKHVVQSQSEEFIEVYFNPQYISIRNIDSKQ